MREIEVLLLDPLPPPLETEIDTVFRVLREAALQDGTPLQRVRGILPRGGGVVSPALLDRLPAVEIIAVNGVGVDGIDLADAKRRGVHVTNTPDIVTADTADLAIGLMIALSRRLCLNDRFVRDGHWRPGPEGRPPFAHSLSHQKVGIVGLGKIGAAIAKRCEPMVAEIAYHSRNPRPEAPYRYAPRLKDLARESDILFIAADGGARGLISAEVIEALGKKGALINIARGGVIDERAMVAALVEGRLGGAALDVFANEPHAPPELFALENVVLQPHVGTATFETRHAMGRLAIDNLRAHFSGAPLLTPVV
jgi:lactate dehydrogenase-like 2-hydroxyacid dehydrogenase